MSSSRLRPWLCVVLVGVLLNVRPAHGWHARDHIMVATSAVKALPDSVPAFFREGASIVASISVDPDLIKSRALPQITSAERPEHYLDVELLRGTPLPATRYEYLALCATMGLDPAKVGTLPYALAEWAQRLTMAMAEHRRWPDDPAVRIKCLVYAGILAHYAGDACQPLHLTVDFDGRTLPDGRSPRSGIHDKVDGLFATLGLDAPAAAAGLALQPVPDVWKAVLAQMDESRGRIDQVYALEAKLPANGTPAPQPDAQVVALATERLRASVAFTARLYLAAWEQSATLSLPNWRTELGPDAKTGTDARPTP